MKKRYIGHLLIANPTIIEEGLEKSVHICLTHTDNMGITLQLNKLNEETNLSIIAQTLGIPYYSMDPVYYGGNISTDKIQIVHSLDWRGLGTIQLTKTIGVTQDISILAALAKGGGPQYFRACAGYWLFDNGRFDTQLASYKDPDEPIKWETLPATIDTVFNTDPEFMWEECLQQCIVSKVKTFF